MCNKRQAWKMVGKLITTLTAATGDTKSDVLVEEADGPLIGFSTGENYSRTVLGGLLLTIKRDTVTLMDNVPLTQLLPDGERHMWPLVDTVTPGTKLQVVLTHNNTGTAATNPVVLVFHHEKKKAC